MLLGYTVSPVTVQGHVLDYKALSLWCSINHLQSPFLLSSYLSLSGIISPLLHHHLSSICCYSTSIWSSLVQINFIIIISIHLSVHIHLDWFYHTGISLILTLLILSTSIGPWDKSILTSPTTNCLTWTFTYRLAPPPFYHLQCLHPHAAFSPFISLILCIRSPNDKQRHGPQDSYRIHFIGISLVSNIATLLLDKH